MSAYNNKWIGVLLALNLVGLAGALVFYFDSTAKALLETAFAQFINSLGVSGPAGMGIIAAILMVVLVITIGGLYMLLQPKVSKAAAPIERVDNKPTTAGTLVAPPIAPQTPVVGGGQPAVTAGSHLKLQ